MRSMSNAALAAMFQQETKAVFLFCLEIQHSSLATPIRVVYNNRDIVHDGHAFLAFPFEISIPGESPEELAKVTLRIDNVSREIVESLRSISSPPLVRLFVVLADSPDTVEAGPFEMTLRDARYNALTVEGELRWEDILNQNYPGHAFTPATTPGLF